MELIAGRNISAYETTSYFFNPHITQEKEYSQKVIHFKS